MISGGAHVQNEKQLSTTLLITPNFALRYREFFEVRLGQSRLVETRAMTDVPTYRSIYLMQSFSNTLTQPLESLKLEEDIQLVFFHPDWVFRDGVRKQPRLDWTCCACTLLPSSSAQSSSCGLCSSCLLLTLSTYRLIVWEVMEQQILHAVLLGQ